MEEEQLTPVNGVAAAQSVRASGTVMVVDDDESVREVAHQMLARTGLTVLRAADGRAALAQFDAEGGKVDLVLLDVTMPVMGGAQTLAALRARGWQGPVVVMSGYSLQAANEEFGQFADTAFLQKPFRRADLIGTVLDRLGRPTPNR